MKKTMKVTLGGILTAFSVIILMLGNIPFAEYIGPTFAGLILLWAVIEMGYSASIFIFIATSLLSVFLSGNKEPAVLYIAFFGYYPILRELLNSKIKSKVLNIILKILLFNVSMVAAYAVLIFVFSMPVEELMEFGKWSAIILLLLGNILFFIYEFAILRIKLVYLKVWQKKIRKIMKIK